ncbi:MAG: hypothetical protein KF900_14155 [Bacteroidetes bacterium]|nr:hypothetical protein [Bacteroidota bacterium]
MENTVNSRVFLLKNKLGLTDVQFCGRSNISTFTLNKIKNNEKTTPKIYDAIVNAFNVNREWLLNGTGEMFKPVPLEVAHKLGEEAIFENALIKQLSSENNRLQKEVERLWGILGNYLPAKQASANFKKLINLTAPMPLKIAA